VEASHGASRTKGTYLKSKYYRIAAKRGKKRAKVAIAHKILIAAYYILKDKTAYRELGEGYLDQRQKEHLKQYWVKKLEKLGVQVTISEPESEEPEKKAA
jgi:hypothetical protein